MNWTRLLNRLKGRPANHEADLDEELSFHAEMKSQALDGDTAAARRAMGNLTLAREDAREAWSIRWLADAARDVRYGVRALLAQPGFTLAAVLAMVLGIGVNAVLFNVYNALALAPYAIRDPGSTVQIWAARGRGWGGFSWPEYRYLRTHSQTLAGLVASANTPVRVRRGEGAWAGEASAASDNFFTITGTGMAAGRAFSAAAEGGDPHHPAAEAVLHYDTWAARYGADPAVIGTWLDINGHRLQLVGVAAAGFSGPSPTHPDLWIPGGWRDAFEPDLKSLDNPDACCVQVLGRLKPGITQAGVEAELNTLRAQFLASVQQQESPRTRLTSPTLLAIPKAARFALPLFLAMAVTAGLILLLACANVANLQIARAMSRRREIAVRIAMGAGRGRVLRQLAAESLLLAALAGAGGLAIASWAPSRLVGLIAQEARLSIRFDNDHRVLLFVAGVTVAVAVLSGLLPAWSAVRDSATARGKTGWSGSRSTASNGRLRTFLLAAQVALSAVLLSGAMLLVRAFDHARHQDVGFSHERVILLSLGLDSSGLSDAQARLLLPPLVNRISSVSGVESVAYGSALPFTNSNNSMGIPSPNGRDQIRLGYDHVSASYFDTLGIRLLAGRGFSQADQLRGGEAAVVNQAAAEVLWPGESPLGKPLHPGSKTIIAGVAPNLTTSQLGTERDPYAWIASPGGRNLNLAIRFTPGAGDALMAALPGIARQQDQRFAASASRYSTAVAAGLRSASLSAAVAAVIGSLALLLACIGIYGVAAYSVSQRRREIGVRMALGANPGGILAMVLRQNLRTVAVGSAIGVIGAVGFGRLLESMLYGVAPADPVSLAAAIGTLAITAALATWAPASEAASIDPAIALRPD